MLLMAALATAAPLTACSSDDEGDEPAKSSTSTTEAATDDTAADDSTDSTDEDTSETTEEDSTETTEEAASGDIGTTELRDFLNEKDAAIGALFDWDTGDGIIGVNYLGVQTVGLYAVEIDADTALAACELASEFVFELDEEADIEIYTGGYTDGVKIVSRTGSAGTCAAV
jgi:hypothetical protein